MAKSSFYENSPQPPGSPPAYTPSNPSTAKTDAPSSFFTGGPGDYQNVPPLSEVSAEAAAAAASAAQAATDAAIANADVTTITAIVNDSAVRYDVAQALTAPQQAQAQANIGLGGSGITISSHFVAIGGGISLAYGDISGLATVAHTGSASDITTGTLPAAQLPNPSATTLGGVESVAAVAHQWIDSISTLGVPHLSQPSFSDISGTAAASQLPLPSATTIGGVESLAAVAHQFLTAINTDGTISQAQPAAADVSGLAASATTDTTNANNITSGTLPAARLPNPSATTLGGVESAAAVAHQWIDSISTLGVPHLSQPAAADISGLGTFATQNYATPPAIGGTTPNTGAFSDVITPAIDSPSGGSINITLNGSGSNVSFNKTSGNTSLGQNTSYRFTQVGSVDANNPFWNGLQFLAPQITESSVAQFPALTYYSRCASAADPTDFQWIYGPGNTGNTAQSLKISSFTTSAQTSETQGEIRFTTSVDALQIARSGAVNALGNLTAAKYVQTGVTTVASLPAASGCKGARYFVTDANATTFWSTVAGGGTNNVPVTSDGTNWRIG